MLITFAGVGPIDGREEGLLSGCLDGREDGEVGLVDGCFDGCREG